MPLSVFGSVPNVSEESVLLTARAVSTLIYAGWGDNTAVREGVEVLLAHSKTGSTNEVAAALAAYTRHIHARHIQAHQTHDAAVILPIRKIRRQTQQARTALRIFK